MSKKENFENIRQVLFSFTKKRIFIIWIRMIVSSNLNADVCVSGSATFDKIESDTRLYLLKACLLSDGIGGGGTAAIIIALMLVGAVAVILTVQLR